MPLGNPSGTGSAIIARRTDLTEARRRTDNSSLRGEVDVANVAFAGATRPLPPRKHGRHSFTPISSQHEGWSGTEARPYGVWRGIRSSERCVHTVVSGILDSGGEKAS